MSLSFKSRKSYSLRASRQIVFRQSHRRHIHIADLGATAKDSAGHDLGVKTFPNGALVSNIVIDTSTTTTDAIDYVATDTDGLTSTSTRTVIIEAATTDSKAPALEPLPFP